ncbi:MAG: phytanoyl-CoA dioxygenase family protein [Campylobacteraceae bacterium]|nr:phytanoyl-CoA dioxygenase family protein [Campylobacteraceae bacterium]
MNLTHNQKKEFHENGFLVLKRFAQKNICDDILKQAQKELDEKIAPYETEQEYYNEVESSVTLRRLRQVYQRNDLFKAWMENKEILPILEDLLQDKVVLTLAHHNSIMTKQAKISTVTFWHQDRRYWNFKNDDLISVWLCLDDEYLENGLLEFIPGSHKLDFEKDQFDKNSNFLDEHAKNKELIKKRVHQNLYKGDVVLFHCKTLHHASKNMSKKNKISFVYTVKALSNDAIKNTRSDDKEILLSH